MKNKHFVLKKFIVLAAITLMLAFAFMTVYADEVTDKVPAGVDVLVEGTADGSKASNLFANEDLKVASTEDFAYSGSKSIKVTSKTQDAKLNGYFYVYPEQFLGVSEFDGDGLYYLSFRVRVPDNSAKVGTTTRNGTRVVKAETIDADEWVRMTGLYDASAESKSLEWIWGMDITSDSTVAYIDDVIIAKLKAMPADVAISLTNSVYDYEGGMTLTLTSNFAIDTPDTESITLTNDAELTSASVSEDGLSLSVEVDSLKPGNDYELTIANVKDVFGRVSTPTVSFSTPAEFETVDVSEGNVEGVYTIVKKITNNSTSNVSVGFVLASYNEAGELIDIDMQLLPLSAKGGSDEFTAGVLPGAEYKTFVCNWETLVSLQ